MRFRCRSMSGKKNLSIFIDADDVLWRDNVYYERASRFLYYKTELKKRWTYRTFIQRLDHIEVKRCKKLKYYAEKEYIQSAKIFCSRYGLQLDKNTEHLLLMILERRQKPEVYKNVTKTLQRLVKYGRLYLYTKGKKADYARKLHQANLDIFFFGIVTTTKTSLSFKKLLQQYNLRPSDVVVIGDSYVNDIIPALIAHAHAIYLCNNEAWTPENSVFVDPAVHAIKNFNQIIPIMDSYECK